MKNDHPNRKHPRLKEHDYSQNGCYFVTICVKNREPILSGITAGRDALCQPDLAVSDYGKIVEKYISNINSVYDGNVIVDNYVIMPDHVHLLITLCEADGGLRAARPTLYTIVRSLKTMVTRQIGYSIWQTSFYEHIIRSEQEYCEICNYIENNLIRWLENNNAGGIT